MPTSDPGNPFAQALSAAIAAKGMTLQRITDRLMAADLRVSKATLSYWSSGRSLPTRGRSLGVVEELEQILDVAPGDLVDLIPGGAMVPFGTSSEHLEILARAKRELGLPGSAGWQAEWVHHHAFVTEDGAVRKTRTSYVQVAKVGGVQGWTSVAMGHADRISARGILGVEAVRVLPVSEDLCVAEFRTEVPLARGERLYSIHEFDFGGVGDVSEGSSYTLSRPAPMLVVSATFEGESELPRSAVHVHQPAEGDPVTSPVALRGRTAQVVVASAQPGIHTLDWHW